MAAVASSETLTNKVPSLHALVPPQEAAVNDNRAASKLKERPRAGERRRKWGQAPRDFNRVGKFA
jgi:hypothetical protein